MNKASSGENAKALRSQYFWLVLSVMIAAFMSKLDSYIVNISLPTIAKSFGVTTGQISFTVIVYLLVSTSLLLLFGKMGDRIGFKKVFIGGYAVFTVGSLLCGLSWNIYALVASRFIQGAGGAMLVSAGYAMIPKFLPREIVGWGFGLLGTAVGFGIAVGAPLGGLISRYLSWHWIFLINIPVGVAALIVARRVIPDEGKTDSRGESLAEFDIPGAAISFFGLSLLLLALNMGDELGWGSTWIIGAFISSAVLLVSFVVREHSSPTPLLDFKIFRNRRFVLSSVAAFTAFLVLSGHSFMFPFFLQIEKGFASDKAGFLIMISSIVMILVAPLAGRLSDRLNPAVICTVAMISSAASALFFSQTLSGGMVALVAFLCWFPASAGMFQPPNNSQAMEAAPAADRGAAVGVFTTIGSFGQVLGVAVFETVFSHDLCSLAGTGTADMMTASHADLNHAFSTIYVMAFVLCMIAAGISAMLIAGARREDGEVLLPD
ncbi:MAG: DHA2 family efflux MFS transporter permease subunit [Proteobacteria bacterium]|nr:DHA2 family efflux MFS transporter permease subunit [Pseudomonadota bacterium]MBU4582404.1 DHA2 family efflux MFS transporter permease subunit [Pseudomonadota bacterium]MCG2740310.1 DHA2 family efflux MFS transporter permease subunit [Syntrophaceae bacterium]